MRTCNKLSGKIDFYIAGFNDIESARPYDLLCQMEKSEDALLKMIRTVNAGIEYGEQVIEDLTKFTGPVPEEVVQTIEQEQDGLAASYKAFVDCKKSLTLKEIFKSDDTFLTTLGEAIDASRRLHEQMENIRWIIQEHNVDEEPTGEPKVVSTASEIDEFFANL